MIPLLIAVAGGVETAYRVLQRRGKIPDEPVTFVAFAGGTISGSSVLTGYQVSNAVTVRIRKIDRRHLRRYVAYLTERRYDAGEILWLEGARADASSSPRGW